MIISFFIFVLLSQNHSQDVSTESRRIDSGDEAGEVALLDTSVLSWDVLRQFVKDGS